VLKTIHSILNKKLFFIVKSNNVSFLLSCKLEFEGNKVFFVMGALGGNCMKDIQIIIGSGESDFESACKEVRAIAEKNNTEAAILSWHNRDDNTHSPCCLKCDFGGIPAWEIFGKNHGGRLKIVVNDGQYVFITS
jgi:hypothetical protein